jgi:predicted outer membrane repeat protein
MNTNDDGADSLRQLIRTAHDYDRIYFSPNIANSTITLTSGIISSDRNLTIDGGQNHITIDGNNNGPILGFSRPTTRVIETINNLTFQNGHAPLGFVGGAIDIRGTLTLNNDWFTSNVADRYGGAVGILAFNSAPGDTLTVNDSVFQLNQATLGNGGAIWAGVTQGGGVNVVLNRDTFINNTSGQSGGAVYATGPANTTMQVTDCSFSFNSVTGSGDRISYYGGAIYTTDQLTVQQSTGSSTFDGNRATDGGGAIAYLQSQGNSSSMSLSNTTFQGNRAELGGAVYSEVSTIASTVTVTVTGCLFAQNMSAGPDADQQFMYGAGLYAQDGTAGGGSASLTITNSTFYNNASGFDGGGIALDFANTGTGTNTATFTSLTVYFNDATSSGGGLWISMVGGSQVAVRNSIIAGNTIGGGAANGFDVFGIVTTQGYNLIGRTDGSAGWDATQHDQLGTNANPLDPRLNGLADNGGPTQTLSLQANSPALRAGDWTLRGGLTVLSRDQRGYLRLDAVTIGAFDPDAV